MTIGEVAARVRHLAADPFNVAERCRHWAKLGLLSPAGRQSAGTGNHKQYRPTAVFDAAILVVLTAAGIEPGRHVGGMKHDEGQLTGETRWLRDALFWAAQARIEWMQDQAAGRNEPLYLEIFFVPPGKRYGDVHRGTPTPFEEIAKRSQLDTPAKARPAVSIRIDLGMIFENILVAAREYSEESAAVA
jgi:hypothetical protein